MVMDKLRNLFREWLGVEALDAAVNRRLISLEDDMDLVMEHVGYKDDKIRARRIKANTIKADKLKVGALKADDPKLQPLTLAEQWWRKGADDHRISLPPVDGNSYTLRNGPTVGPLKRHGILWFAPNFRGGWNHDGIHITGNPDLDLVGLRMDHADKLPLEDDVPEVLTDVPGKLPLSDGYRTPSKVGTVAAVKDHLRDCLSKSNDQAYDRGWNDALHYAIAQLDKAVAK